MCYGFPAIRNMLILTVQGSTLDPRTLCVDIITDIPVVMKKLQDFYFSRFSIFNPRLSARLNAYIIIQSAGVPFISNLRQKLKTDSIQIRAGTA